MTESNQFSNEDNEDKVMRIRMRHKAALDAGMSNAEASAYANDPNSPPLPVRSSAQVQSSTATASDSKSGVQLNSSCCVESVAISPPLPPKPAPLVSANNTDRHELDTDRLMTKNSGLPESPDGIQTSDATPGYELGYGPTRKDTRFKKGHPKLGGRKKGQRNARTAFVEIIGEPITLREGKQPRKMSKRDGIYLRITNDALSGNDKAQAKVIALMQKFGLHGEPQDATNREPLTADDSAVLADFLARLGMNAEPKQASEDAAKVETGKAEPASKETKEKKS
jgi:hypothetical protein